MVRLAAVILARDEAHNVDWCVLSLAPWVDATVVWDSGSCDDTVERARRAGALVVQRPFDNYAAQRQAALDAIAADWVLFVDADERITAELGAELRALVDGAGSANGGGNGGEDRPIAGYWIPRRNFIVGHEVRGGGFSPDYQLRLLRRGSAHYVREREVHEIVQLDGGEGWLEHPLIHYNYLTWSQFHRKQQAYAAYEARILAARGVRPRPHNFVLQPLREFRRRYVTLDGYRDGFFGVQLAGWLAYYYGFVPYRLL